MINLAMDVAMRWQQYRVDALVLEKRSHTILSIVLFQTSPILILLFKLHEGHCLLSLPTLALTSSSTNVTSCFGYGICDYIKVLVESTFGSASYS